MATELITWGEKYCLGLDEIDEQHQALVDIINRIWQSIILRSDKQAIFSLIAELEKYTLAHFAAEETAGSRMKCNTPNLLGCAHGKTLQPVDDGRA